MDDKTKVKRKKVEEHDSDFKEAYVKKNDKSEIKHGKKVEAEKHHNKDSGCLIRCCSNYKKDVKHSYRWHAAKKAKRKREKEIYECTVDNKKISLENIERANWPLEKIEELKSRGGASNVRKKNEKNVFDIVAFANSSAPYPNEVHHIVPIEAVWYAIDSLRVEVGSDKENWMWNIATGGILEEPYNIHDSPNVIVLPSLYEHSVATGLPIHRGGHGNYSEFVTRRVNYYIRRAYKDIIPKVKKKEGCDEDSIEAPKIRKKIESISETIYRKYIESAALDKRKFGGMNVDGKEKVGFNESKQHKVRDLLLEKFEYGGPKG